MRRLLKGVGATLFWLVVLLLAAILVAPPFLDRIYYQGSPSAHYDGARFFNPDNGDDSFRTPRAWRPLRMVRFLSGEGRATWPAQVAVSPSRPPRRVAGDAMRATWVGHSTVLVQTQGLNILTDPIWSDRATPIPGMGPKRVRAPGVRFADLPKIDLVLVSHNHYDHMDLPTLRRLWDRDHPLIVTSLGNDRILAAKGVEAVARDWGGRVAVKPGVDVVVERVHHWGSRWGRDRNRALWSGFTVTLPGGNLYFAGDTGLGDGQWPREAAARGPVRLALIPIGAYQPRAMMRGSHIDPVEAVTVFERLGAARAIGVHWGTFQLSAEAIDAPGRLLGRTLGKRGIPADRFVTLEAGRSLEVPQL